MQNRCCVNGCFLNNSSNAHGHQLLTKMILRSFISLRAFTVHSENSLRFGPKWNLDRSEFHFAWTHVNANNEVTYTEVKSQTGLSSLRVSCKRA